MRPCFFFLLAFIYLAPVAVMAAGKSQDFVVAKIISGSEIALVDGRTLALEGIKAPADDDWADKARAALTSIIGTNGVIVEDIATDRYGRVTGQVYIAANNRRIWLQGEMLRQGFVFIYPPTGFETRLADMRMWETKARADKAGIWSDDNYADIPADKAAKAEGRFAFVSGTVVDTARVKDKVYLNFGPDRKTDFTIAIAAHDLHNFRTNDIDPLALKGKTIRVRGWVKRDYGPMISVTDPWQMEIAEGR
jgi:endonuclease YncB( thermonuclease family)